MTSDGLVVLPLCEACILAKSTRAAINRSGPPRTRPAVRLGVIHSDVAGPFPVSRDGHRYYVTFIDGHSNFAFVYPIRDKSEVLSALQGFYAFVRCQFGDGPYPLVLKSLHSDQGGEYSSRAFADFCLEHGIVHHRVAAYSPELNGVAERYNQTIQSMIRSLLIDSGLPLAFWVDALYVAVHVCNRLPSAAVKYRTPFELWMGRIPDLSHLKVFGSVGYVHVPEPQQRKLMPRAFKTIFIGYSPEGRAYRLFNPETGETLLRRDVVFDEHTPAAHLLLRSPAGSSLGGVSFHTPHPASPPTVVTMAPPSDTASAPVLLPPGVERGDGGSQRGIDSPHPPGGADMPPSVLIPDESDYAVPSPASDTTDVGELPAAVSGSPPVVASPPVIDAGISPPAASLSPSPLAHVETAVGPVVPRRSARIRQVYGSSSTVSTSPAEAMAVLDPEVSPTSFYTHLPVNAGLRWWPGGLRAARLRYSACRQPPVRNPALWRRRSQVPTHLGGARQLTVSMRL